MVTTTASKAGWEQAMRGLGYGFVTSLAVRFTVTIRAATLVMSFGLMSFGLAPPAAAQSLPHLAIVLAAETDRPAPGTTTMIALDTRPQPGWHGYWVNPGDAGFAAMFDWKLPPGVRADPPAYPLPKPLLIAGLMNYVFDAPYAPLVRLHVAPNLAAGTRLHLALHAAYLVCTVQICVPESAQLAIDLVVGDGRVSPAARARFDAWRSALPRPLGATATWQRVGTDVRIAIPYPAGARLGAAHFFPITPGVIDNAANQSIERDGDRVVITTRTATAPGAAAVGHLAGVLDTGASAGLDLLAVPGVVTHRSAASGVASLAAFGLTLAGAVLGGLILNVMPCVFPILSLKALALARGHVDEAAARREAIGYAGGVISVCVALGAIILALRAGGGAVGWAFQLQDPRAVALLLLLSVALALNFAGLFEFVTPAFAGRTGSSGGAGNAFATGALAAFVATPCTGPFMAAALGAALVLPAAAALLVFAGLGLGLALPFLALGFVPALRRRLPRPGGWMLVFRRWLSVPMWLTAVALAWVLGHQAGTDGLGVALLASLATGLLLWLAGLRQHGGRAVGGVPLVGMLIVAVATPILVHRSPRRIASVAAVDAAGTMPFSEALLARFRAADRPVFVYFTADWCLTCKVNERLAIDVAATRRAFAARHVVVLVGDWTDGDPALGRFIAAHGRAGVPLYLYYPPGGAARELPQLLTPDMLAALG